MKLYFKRSLKFGRNFKSMRNMTLRVMLWIRFAFKSSILQLNQFIYH